METTQLQKAIVIAKKDGWRNTSTDRYVLGAYYSGKKRNGNEILRIYTSNLNYLMPIAVKVRDEIAEKSQGYGVYSRLYDAYYELKLDSNNQYTELFNALYEAVILLENE